MITVQEIDTQIEDVKALLEGLNLHAVAREIQALHGEVYEIKKQIAKHEDEYSKLSNVQHMAFKQLHLLREVKSTFDTAITNAPAQ